MSTHTAVITRIATGDRRGDNATTWLSWPVSMTCSSGPHHLRKLRQPASYAQRIPTLIVVVHDGGRRVLRVEPV
jgi:hypothetical protein